MISASNAISIEAVFISSFSPTLPSSLVHPLTPLKREYQSGRPTLNVVKLNCDEAFKPNQGVIGIVARESKGSILVCSGEK